MGTVLNQMENRFSDFHFLSYGWLYLQFGPLCPEKGYVDPPAFSPSEVAIFIWKMRNVLKRMKNHISDFYFSSYSENSSKIGNFEYKNDHILKTLDRKNLKINFSFVSADSASII